MRLHTLLVVSHLAAAAVGGLLAVVVVQGVGSLLTQAVLLAIATGLVAIGGLALAGRIRHGLRLMVQAAAKGKRSDDFGVGLYELDWAAAQLSEYSERWSDAASSAREQVRDIEELLLDLDRRASTRDRGGQTAGSQLRQLMAGISDSADGELSQILTGTQEISRCVQEIAEGADDQRDAVSKTATYVEQLSAEISTVVRDSAGAQEAVGAVRTVALETVGLCDELVTGMASLQSRLESNERRLRAVGDQSREIGAIVENIGSIASRTDLLALNASIESVRAGEHGRGFAIVAEEVHRLAEQSAQSTREVAVLLESSQLEAQESIHVVAEEQQQIAREMDRIREASAAIQRMLQILDESSGQVGGISNAAEHQMTTAHDLTVAVERIANVVKATRSFAEKAKWTTKSLAKATQEFNVVLTPLRRSTGRRGPLQSHSPEDEASPVEALNLAN